MATLVLSVVLFRPPPSHSGSDPLGTHHSLIGWSVAGKPIVAIETGDFDSRHSALVVGCVHGNEPAGIAVASELAHSSPPPEVDLWIVSVLNPDGVAMGARGNAHGVDINRNFPWRWRPLHGLFDSGARPLSEPESRAVVRLVHRIRPRVSIWFHQHMDVVDESGGSVTVERRFSRLARLRLARLVREPGSAVGWENHVLPRSTAFVVELPAGSLTHSAAHRYAAAVVSVAR